MKKAETRVKDKEAENSRRDERTCALLGESSRLLEDNTSTMRSASWPKNAEG